MCLFCCLVHRVIVTISKRCRDFKVSTIFVVSESSEVTVLKTIEGTAAAVKSIQSCLPLFDPMDYSPPGSSDHGFFQARILELVAISYFSVCIYTQGNANHYTHATFSLFSSSTQVFPYHVYLNNDFMNVREQISLQVNYFATEGNQNMFRSWIAGSNGSSIFNFRTVFYSACTSLHSNSVQELPFLHIFACICYLIFFYNRLLTCVRWFQFACPQ